MSRTHLITGAGSGIGAAVAGRLLRRGDSLVLLARSAERAEELERRFSGAGSVVADLAQAEDVAALDLPDVLDSVVHAAGVVHLSTVAALEPDQWRDHLEVNLLAPAVLTSRALPAVRAAHGTVVFLNSGSGLSAKSDWSAYAASKFGLRALADALRAEEQEHGVRVSSIYPGRTATAMQKLVHTQEGKKYDPDAWIQPGTVADAVLHVLDLPPDATIPDLRVSPS